ncbi:hypersensitive response-inducing protein [Seiridium cupressi]
MKPIGLPSVFLISSAAAQCGPERDYQWTVANLSASASPHSTISYFSLDLTTNDTIVHCVGYGSTYQVLGNLPRTNCTKDISFSWSQIGPGEGTGAILQLFDSAKDKRAVHLIPSAEIVWENQMPNPNGRIQVYEGPRSFNVTLRSSYGGYGDYGGGIKVQTQKP